MAISGVIAPWRPCVACTSDFRRKERNVAEKQRRNVTRGCCSRFAIQCAFRSEEEIVLPSRVSVEEEMQTQRNRVQNLFDCVLMKSFCTM